LPRTVEKVAAGVGLAEDAAPATDVDEGAGPAEGSSGMLGREEIAGIMALSSRS
jgi:hypothetical protein